LPLVDDGLPVDEVGEWAADKHTRLERYVDIYRGVRKKFLEGPSGTASYIDLFCATGRSKIRETGELIEGSPLVAFRKARDRGQPFSHIYLGDIRPEAVAAAGTRIRNAGGTCVEHVGTSEEVARRVVASVNKFGLHFALLDPYKLEALTFATVKTLAQLKRIDMMLHVSAMDLQRNWDKYTQQDPSPLDAFAPGWRDNVDLHQAMPAARAQLLDYWCTLVQRLGFARPRAELITGSKNQRLYWLAFISREPIANDFWQKIRYIDGQDDLLGGLF
jgi:three-Cys-motif partner protein